jgi:hypothetical protein
MSALGQADMRGAHVLGQTWKAVPLTALEETPYLKSLRGG